VSFGLSGVSVKRATNPSFAGWIGDGPSFSTGSREPGVVIHSLLLVVPARTTESGPTTARR
jgi:hypothetical protein